MKKSLIFNTFGILLLLLLLFGCDMNFRSNPTIAQKENNITTVDLNINQTAAKDADTIEISSLLINRAGLPVQETKTTYEKADFNNKSTIPYDLKWHGKHEITISYLKGGKKLTTDFVDYILTADEYNIALLEATVPTSYFTLIAADEDGSYFNTLLGEDFKYNPDAPKIITMERAGSYNWKKLLPNMYGCPFLSKHQLEESYICGTSYVTEHVKAMKDYMTYLHELNTSSKFTIFINDLSNDLVLYLLADTGIGYANSQIVMLSDGTGSYTTVTDCYGSTAENDTSMQKYQQLEQLWYKVKQKALIHDYTYMIDLHNYSNTFGRMADDLQPVQMMDNELNIRWIVNRKRTQTFGDTEMSNKYIVNNPDVIELNIYNLYKNLTQEEQNNVRQLLKVDFDMINEAEKQGKKIMLFMGSFGDTTSMHLLDYLKFITQYVGPEYAVFYKGHPGDMANLTSDKIEPLSNLGVKILDFTVPAEFFYLFKGGLSGSGYPSTTFGNIISEIDRIPVIAETTYESMSDNSYNYKDKVEIYISRQEDGKYFVQDRKLNRTGIWDPSTDIDQIVWKQN